MQLRLLLHRLPEELAVHENELYCPDPLERLSLWARGLIHGGNEKEVEARIAEIEREIRGWLEQERWETLPEPQQILLQKLEWTARETPLLNGRKHHLFHHDRCHPGLILPLEEKGRFLNDPKEEPWRYLLRSVVGLLPSSLSSFSKGAESIVRKEAPFPRSRSLRIQWIGHATMLIQIANMNILTDPVFGFVAPCFRRHNEPGISFEELPATNAILISHNHSDHFEKQTLLRLRAQQPHLLVPYGLDSWFKERGFRSAIGHRWHTETTTWNEEGPVHFTFLPARHWTTRRLDVNETLWGGWLIQAEGKTIYFAGDTGFDQQMFRQIREEYGPIDIALLPIAPENERDVHLSSRDALHALEELDAKVMIPIHWGTYRTGSETMLSPIESLERVLKEERYAPLRDRICILHIGECWKETNF